MNGIVGREQQNVYVFQARECFYIPLSPNIRIHLFTVSLSLFSSLSFFALSNLETQNIASTLTYFALALYLFTGLSPPLSTEMSIQTIIANDRQPKRDRETANFSPNHKPQTTNRAIPHVQPLVSCDEGERVCGDDWSIASA